MKFVPLVVKISKDAITRTQLIALINPTQQETFLPTEKNKYISTSWACFAKCTQKNGIKYALKRCVWKLNLPLNSVNTYDDDKGFRIYELAVRDKLQRNAASQHTRNRSLSSLLRSSVRFWLFIFLIFGWVL